MRYTPLVLALVLGVSIPPALASAQEPSNLVGGYGGLSLNDFSSPRPDVGVTFGKALTPNIQAIGEFGRVDDMLPSIVNELIAITPYGFKVSALYGEGGVRLLASQGRVTPYAEATAGIARLRPHVSGFGSTADAIAGIALGFLRTTEPIVGLGGGVLLRGGPVVVDLGYRYKQVFGDNVVTNLLSTGGNLSVNQVRFGVAVRF